MQYSNLDQKCASVQYLVGQGDYWLFWMIQYKLFNQPEMRTIVFWHLHNKLIQLTSEPWLIVFLNSGRSGMPKITHGTRKKSIGVKLFLPNSIFYLTLGEHIDSMQLLPYLTISYKLCFMLCPLVFSPSIQHFLGLPFRSVVG